MGEKKRGGHEKRPSDRPRPAPSLHTAQARLRCAQVERTLAPYPRSTTNASAPSSARKAISGAEEAELILALRGNEDDGSDHLYIDVGGGSTELTWLRDGKATMSSDRTLGGSGWVWFSIATTAPTGLAKGKYVVKLRAGDALLGYQEFVVN